MKRLATLILVLALAGCAVGPDFEPPAAPQDSHYTTGKDPSRTTEAEGVAQTFQTESKIDADWWKLFNSPKLETVIKDAMANNPGLEAAQANLQQSQDNLHSGYGIFYPQITGNAGASRQQNSTASFGEKTPPSIFNLFTLSASVSYALDIFGGQRRLVEELGAEVDAQRATEQATWLTLSANIVNTVVAKAAYTDEIEATKQLIAMQKEQVELAEDQARAGTIPYTNVLSLQTQLSANEAILPQLEQKLSQADNLLATLAGHTPAQWTPPSLNLSNLILPKDLPVSLPSDLVRQRPDILIAEATMHAASANIGVATAAMLPSFTLNAGYGTNSNATNTLLAASGNFWSLGANMAAPIFNGGTLWYQREAAEDTYQQASANYRQTVLGAFEQVADTLRALEHDAETLKAQDMALRSADQNLHLTTANYKAGLAAYSDVLIADAQYRQAVIGHLQASASRYQDTVALFAALGGGWWNIKSEDAPGSVDKKAVE